MAEHRLGGNRVPVLTATFAVSSGDVVGTYKTTSGNLLHEKLSPTVPRYGQIPADSRYKRRPTRQISTLYRLDVVQHGHRDSHRSDSSSGVSPAAVPLIRETEWRWPHTSHGSTPRQSNRRQPAPCCVALDRSGERTQCLRTVQQHGPSAHDRCKSTHWDVKSPRNTSCSVVPPCSITALTHRPAESVGHSTTPR